jgi:hypothetical protein
MSEWVPGIVATVLGALAAISFARTQHADATDDEALTGAERDLQLRLEQLRELMLEEHLFDEATFAEEKSRLEHAAGAALALRDSERQRASKDKTPPPTTAPKRSSFSKRHPSLVGAIWGAASVAFIWALFAQVTSVEKHAGRSISPANYQALLVLSAIALETGDSDQLLQAWSMYYQQPEPRRVPPRLQHATDWLEDHLDHE